MDEENIILNFNNIPDVPSREDTNEKYIDVLNDLLVEENQINFNNIEEMMDEQRTNTQGD